MCRSSTVLRGIHRRDVTYSHQIPAQHTEPEQGSHLLESTLFYLPPVADALALTDTTRWWFALGVETLVRGPSWEGIEQIAEALKCRIEQLPQCGLRFSSEDYRPGKSI